MKIHVTANHRYIDEIQTIAQVFFPHAKFCYGDVPRVPTKYAIVSSIENDKIHSEVYSSSKFPTHVVQKSELIGQYVLSTSSHPNYLTKKRLVMLALYHALQDAIGAFTPWGALTGVRPTKMVREWMTDGLSDAQVSYVLRKIFCVQDDRATLAIDVAHAENRLAQNILSGYPTGSGSSNALKPIGIYISIPFCPSRCVYCSFNTAHKPWDEEMQAQYIQAVITECKEIPRKLREMNGLISSIYIGGGTPTALADCLLEQLLTAVREVISKSTRKTAYEGKSDCMEFTVEAGRPDTITRSNLRLMHNYGVNRISINPQTVNDKTLELIGRNHTTSDFYQAYETAREEGFTCINADIIAGLPGESPADMHNTMEAMARLKPENITVHTLAIKRASKLNEQRSEQLLCNHKVSRKKSDSYNTSQPNHSLPDAATIENQLKIAHEGCVSQGLLPYYLYRQKNMAALFENTGYSLPGHECLYNIGMMSEIQTVLGVGAGAVSKYLENNLITRIFNPKNPDIYIERRSKS